MSLDFLILSSLSSSSSSSSGSLSSSSRSRSKATRPNQFQAQGDTFVDLVKETPYKTILKVKTEYELSLVKSQLHWLLLVRMRDSDEAYISIEITTSNMTDLKPIMYIYGDKGSNNSEGNSSCKVRNETHRCVQDCW